ncbi:MAG: glucosaminidase domain-containing protein [Pseudomonadota bacterium]|nr:glucosaminidase domain-containing protein [Pseudomonadota bacterium]
MPNSVLRQRIGQIILTVVGIVVAVSCGSEPPNELQLAACRTSKNLCKDTMTRDLLAVPDIATNEALRAYLISKDNVHNSPFRTKTNGINDLDALIHGLYLVKGLYGINPVFALALSIHESNWGRSRIAKDKANLWGYGAKDSCPYDCAYEFSTYAEGFNRVFFRIKSSYLTEGGKFYQDCSDNREVICADGRKRASNACGLSLAGMNCRYASDSSWGDKIRLQMNNINNFLQDRCEDYSI